MNFKSIFLALLSLTFCGLSHGEEVSKSAIEAETKIQLEGAARTWLATVKRVQRVSYPLLRAAAPNCMGFRNLVPGVLPMDSETVPEQLRPTAERLFQLGKDKRMRFLNVIPGTPAHAAGLRDNDELVRIGGQAFDKGVGRTALIVRAMAGQSPHGEEILFQIIRDGALHQIWVKPEWSCDYNIGVSVMEVINAYNAFNQMTIPTGMANFFSSDSDLAVVIGHEIGHFLLRHSEAGIVRTTQGKQADHRKQAQDRERDADNIGLLLAAAAGYDIRQAQAVWRRMSVANPESIDVKAEGTHPSTPERFVRLKTIVEDIARRQASGEALSISRQTLPTYFGENADKEFALFAEYFRGLAKKPEGIEARLARVSPGMLVVQKLPIVQDVRINRWDGIPALSSAGLVAYQDFLNDLRSPRAFALNADGDWGMAFGNEAESRAMNSCLARQSKTCHRYVLNNALVAQTSELDAMRTHQALLHGQRVPVTQEKKHSLGIPADSGFAKVDDLAAVPIADRYRDKYKEFLAKNSPKAFVIRSDGSYRYRFGESDAMERVFNQCELNGETCWLYAVDDRVVWQKDLALRVRSTNQLPPSSN